jgi:DHA2 family methylenomycin A resistance protein-like MFS transporter
MTESTDLDPSTPLPVRLKGVLASHKALVALVIVTIATVIFPPFLRLLGQQRYDILGISEEQWSIFVASRGLVFILFVLAAGVLGDIRGRRRMLLWILAAFIIGNIFLVFRSPFTISYLIVYTILAILVVMINILSVTLVILSYEGRTQLIALVVYSIITGAGFLLAPILTRAIGRQFGANLVFMLPLLLAALGFRLTVKNIPERPSEGNVRHQDVIALAVWTTGLCLIIYAGVLSGGLGWTHPLVLTGLALGGLILLALAWLRGQRLPGKYRFRLVSGRELSMAVFAGVVLYLAFYAIVVQIFNFLNKVLQYNLVIAGLAMAPILIGALVQNSKIIRWTSQLRTRQAMSLGLALIGIPALVLSLLDTEISYWILLPSLVLVGFGFILCNTQRLLLLASSVPRNLAATVQSIGGATANLGGALAYAFMMTLVTGFGLRAYVQTLEEFGLSQAFITSRLFRLAEFGEQISVVSASDEQIDLLREIDFWLVQAYVTGLSRAMLVLGIVCLFSAAIVYVGLRGAQEGGASFEEHGDKPAAT